jgi:N-acetylglucosamine kinase-like BadF-type ATPase
VDVSSDVVEISKQILIPLMDGVPYILKNDAFGCLRGGTPDSFGVMINCGTGQVAVGRNRQGVEIRVGGFGWDFGDFAGGSVISQAAVAAAVRANDGRGESTSLVEALLTAANLPDMPAFIERTYRDGSFVRSLGIPKITFGESRNGDPVARRIILSVAQEMAVTALTLIRRLGMESESFDLITAGSVFKGDDPVFLQSIKSEVHEVAPQAHFRIPLYPPVIGAVLLAFEEDGGVTSESFNRNLENSLLSLTQAHDRKQSL